VRTALVARVCTPPDDGHQRSPLLDVPGLDALLAHTYNLPELQQIGNDVDTFADKHGGKPDRILASLTRRLVEMHREELRPALTRHQLLWADTVGLLEAHAERLGAAEFHRRIKDDASALVSELLEAQTASSSREEHTGFLSTGL